ncbi:unnamed protein product, partial [Cladocopium goreaui]
VGMLIGLYSLCEVIFSPLWGTFADKVGRKPALLIGLGGSCIAPVMFGLGTSLPTIFAARALDGFFCGNIGVTRTYLGEIVDESNEAKGFSFLALCFSAGLFVGPILGGELLGAANWAPWAPWGWDGWMMVDWILKVEKWSCVAGRIKEVKGSLSIKAQYITSSFGEERLVV